MYVDLTNVRAYLDRRDNVVRLTVADPRLSTGVNISVRRDTEHDRALRELFEDEIPVEPEIEPIPFHPRYAVRRRTRGDFSLAYDLGPGVGKDLGPVSDAFTPAHPHLVITGNAKTGKSSLLAHLALSLATRNGPADLRLRLFEPYGGVHLHPLGDLDVVDSHFGPRDSVESGLEAQVEEIDRREKLFARLGAGSVHEARRRGLGSTEPELYVPFIVVVIDDAASFVRNTRALVAMNEILARGPRVGVYLAVAFDQFVLPGLHIDEEPLPADHSGGSISSRRINLATSKRWGSAKPSNGVPLGLGSFSDTPGASSLFILPSFPHGVGAVVRTILPKIVIANVPALTLPNRDGGLTVDLGVALGNREGEVLVKDFTRERPHLLIGGWLGTGKTVFLTNTLLSLASRNSVRDLSIRLIDPAGELTPLSGLDHVGDYVQQKGRHGWKEFCEHAVAVLERTVEEIEARQAAIRAFTKSTFGAPGSRTGPTPRFPFIVMAMTATHSLLGDSDGMSTADKGLRARAWTAVEKIAAYGGDAGVSLVIEMSNGDVPPFGAIRSKCEAVSFGLDPKHQVEAVILTGREKLELPKRHAIMAGEDGHPSVFFVPFAGPTSESVIAGLVEKIRAMPERS